eukprot:Partr_v1_DN28895_c1_g1_i2_m34401 putative fatty acid elongase
MRTPLYDSLAPLYAHYAPLVSRSLPKSAADFNFQKHAGLVGDQLFVAKFLGVYLAIVALHYAARPVFQFLARIFGPLFQLIFIVHNIVLSAGSAVLLALIVENLAPRVVRHGLMWGICHRDAYEEDHRLEFFYYINYLLKYYELIDTCLLILKGKRLEFLHWYHHAATLYLCYSQLVGRTSISWVPIVLNLIVHIIMYYYYARTAISSAPVWWKKHLTTMQIVQFVLDLAVINLAMYMIIVKLYGKQISEFVGVKVSQFPTVTWGSLGRGSEEWTDYGKQATCYGPLSAGITGWLILSSYLMLFVQFFISTYLKKTRGSGSKVKRQ